MRENDQDELQVYVWFEVENLARTVQLWVANAAELQVFVSLRTTLTQQVNASFQCAGFDRLLS